MIRKAFLMHVNPDAHAEYERRHRPICQKWWAHMGDVMPSNPDNSPVSEPLREVFHLD
jgi:L-rhamnose mutarotase